MKTALLINAFFSCLSGIILIFWPGQFANIFAVKNATPFWIVGVVLVFFSFTIFYEVKRQNPLAILWIVFQDLLWVLVSLYFIIANPFEISVNGNVVILLVAIVVLFMAIHQSLALANLDGIGEGGIKRLSYTRKVATTKSETWKLISDIRHYHVVAPNIDDVKIVSGEGKGMVRSCSHGKDSWTETCTIWNEEEIFAFVADTSAPEYPFPLKYLKGSWQVQEVDFSTTNILLSFEFTYTYKIMNILIHPFLKYKFKKITGTLLDNWQRQLEKETVYEKTFSDYPK